MRIAYRPDTRCYAALKRLVEAFKAAEQQLPPCRLTRRRWTAYVLDLQRVESGTRGRRRWRTIARIEAMSSDSDTEKLDDARLEIEVRVSSDAHEVASVMEKLVAHGLPYEIKIIV